MSDASQDNGRDTAQDAGILAALPRTRPQRSSPRRAAARGGAPKTATATKATTHANGRPKKAKAGTAAPVKKQNTAADATAAKKATATNRSPVRASVPRLRPVKLQTTRMRSAHEEPPVPRQGYEPEDEVELGATVDPPSGVELVESVADIVGELAGAGLTAGGRLLKDALSLLRRP
jgi:hypothetical protein